MNSVFSKPLILKLGIRDYAWLRCLFARLAAKFRGLL
jgi:hypothetical protein